MSSKLISRRKTARTAYSNLFSAAAPAALLLAGAAIVGQFSLSQPLITETERALNDGSFLASDFFEKNWIVPASQTFFVAEQTTGKHITVQGLLSNPNEGEVRSSTSGEISTLLVENGQYVEKGQEIARLTTGVAPAAAESSATSPLDQWHDRAEKEQLAAAREQEKLESQAKAAGEELKKAQARVVAAQRRVSDARQLVARLKDGEELLRGQAELTPIPKAEANVRKPAERARDKAALLKESQELQKAAEAAEAKAKAAEKAANAADERVRAEQSHLSAVSSPEKISEEKEKTSVNSETSREVSSSKESVSAGEKKSTSERKSTLETSNELTKNGASARAQAVQARREHTRLLAQAVEARKRSNLAAQRVAQGLHVFEEEERKGSEAAAAKTSRSTPDAREKLTVAEVSRIVRAAIQESNDAVADAERLQRTIDGHRQRISRSHQRFEQSSQKLREAQQRIWENVPAMRTTQSPITAEHSGILTWRVAPLQIVKPDEKIAEIGRPDRLEVLIEDRSDAWKQLQADQQLVALIRRKEAASSPPSGSGGQASLMQTSASVSSEKFRPVTAEMKEGVSGFGAPTSARILEVIPPENPESPAQIRIAVHNPPQEKEDNRNGRSPRAFAPGMVAFLSLPGEPLQTSIRIPTASVRRGEGGRTYVAVLTPIENQALVQTLDLCRIEWREVFLAPGDGQSNRVKMGLKEGERLVLRPNELYQFTLTYGERATVGVEQA